MSQNQYVKLASRSLASLCDLAAVLDQVETQNSQGELVADVLREAHRLWEHLAWSDGALNDHERAVLEVIVGRAVALGHYETVSKLFGKTTQASGLPEFLRVAALSQERDPRLVMRMINHLETFGYGILASDREIHEAELANLKDYIGRLRAEVETTRCDSRLTNHVALA